MKRGRRLIYNTIFITILTGCYTPRYVYSPIVQNVPVLLQKCDSKVAINLSSNLSTKTSGNDNKNRGYDLQAAYAISNHLAAEVLFAHRTEKNSGDYNSGYYDSSTINYKRDIGELGLGYFHAYGMNKQYVFQIFCGLGLGKSSFTDEGRDRNNNPYNRFHRMSVTKLFIQPAFMIRQKDFFAGALSSRMSLVYFHHILTDYTSGELDNYKLDSLNYRPRLFWEPAITNIFEFKKIPGLRLEFQIGMAFLVSKTFVDYRSFNFSFGIMTNLPKLLYHKKTLQKSTN